MKFEKLNEVFEVIEQRKNFANQKESYVAKLKAQGINAVLQKIGEESAEVIIAAKDNDKKAVVHEVADLFFHTLVLLSFQNISPQEISAELINREKKNKKNE